MNERITKSETHAPAPLAHLPGQPYTQAQDAQERPMKGSETERLAQRGESLTRAEKLLVTVFVTMFATLGTGGALAFTTLSGQLVDMQGQTSAQLLDMQGQTSAQLLDMQKQIGALRTEMHEEIGNLSERMTRVEERLTRVEQRITRVEARMTRVEERMTRVEQRMTGIESFIRTHHGPPAGP